eukprot:2647529-Pyramimonas_sp.AAC.1
MARLVLEDPDLDEKMDGGPILEQLSEIDVESVVDRVEVDSYPSAGPCWTASIQTEDRQGEAHEEDAIPRLEWHKGSRRRRRCVQAGRQNGPDSNRPSSLQEVRAGVEGEEPDQDPDRDPDQDPDEEGAADEVQVRGQFDQEGPPEQPREAG